ncbi:MAG: hypothetical protein N2746_09485 [Deltaproteobacteria bacterium]|nr:hypothetical protein [Deltaproteobacteria bacterium]
MSKNSFLSFVIPCFFLIYCAGTKNIQRIDSPEDYYDSETPTISNPTEAKEIKEAKSEDDNTSKNLSPSQQQKPSTNQKSQPPGQKNEIKSEVHQNLIKTDEQQSSQNIQEDLGDDSWGKDESKVRIKQKDKEKIKDSTLDDDKWGRE